MNHNKHFLKIQEPTSILPFLHIIENLKATPRTGWLNFNIENPESIASHMYRMSIISMLCTTPSINRDKCIKMALIHDMAESIVGDITPFDQISPEEKHKRELDAMLTLTSKILPKTQSMAAKEMLDLFLEYEEGKTEEALFVKDIDKFELLVQAIEYEKKTKKNLQQFLCVLPKIKNPLILEWVDDVLKERDEFWKSIDH
ncbi:unnamed protein product [Pneumocystis jirovecii]|uniref:5'-deoxynucleotidase n=2 Tax=Pneumocystis jirovecii TaxID=42068 RepID=L0PFG9_PNEJI|nr:uncharacterized protein T551_01936 [Pneumocystis jirovecii RU7]KTW29992.1 hypothetical protein T551_01936 [Pneumocystis jirovecii RU7]CCJ30819.1 unnamed protein product [Pneumocystis jirovecii]